LKLPKKAKLALLVNMISPARIPVYAGLAEEFDLLLVHGGREPNRDSWQDHGYRLPGARVVKAWGWQIPVRRRQNGQAFDELYIHFNPGFFWHLLRFSPDLIVTNEMGARTFLALLYGTVFRKPVWVWWGGTIHTESKKSGLVRRGLRRVFAWWAKHWISYGRSSTHYLLTLGIDKRRIVEIQNSADDRHYKMPPEPLLALEPRPVVLYVGQFIARKGLRLLLEAAAVAGRMGAEFSLLLVGSGPEKKAMEELVNRLGLRNVRFLSSQRPEDMPAIYRSADVLVFPTLEDPWGLVANEAMLSGLPVLCSLHAGCAQELFAPESIFDPEDQQEFARKLREAVAGRLPAPDMTRLKSSQQVTKELVAALQSSLQKPRLAAGAAPDGAAA
jgi:glycosyltransferase involved in cell wall biosynthesis